jgi:hypothetical protein
MVVFVILSVPSLGYPGRDIVYCALTPGMVLRDCVWLTDTHTLLLQFNSPVQPRKRQRQHGMQNRQRRKRQQGESKQVRDKNQGGRGGEFSKKKKSCRSRGRGTRQKRLVQRTNKFVKDRITYVVRAQYS